METPTKSQAVKKLIEDLGGQATWPEIYDKIETYYPSAKKSIHWQEGIRGVVYRDIRAGINFDFAEKGVIKLRK